MRGSILLVKSQPCDSSYGIYLVCPYNETMLNKLSTGGRGCLSCWQLVIDASPCIISSFKSGTMTDAASILNDTPLLVITLIQAEVSFV